MNDQYPHIIQLPKITDPRGNLSFFENDTHLPFRIQRVFWIYDVPGGEERGGHAYHNTEEFIVALSGSFDVVLDNGDGQKQTYHLNRSYYGLYVPRMVWREMTNFSTNSLALVVASTLYQASEYIRDYNDYWAFKHSKTILPLILQKEVISNELSFSTSGRFTSLDYCQLFILDKHHSDRKGNLSVVENNIIIPFEARRCYYLYDIPGGESRGAHAHKCLEQLLIAVSGSFSLKLDDGKGGIRTFTLNRPYQGLYIAPGIWRDLYDFSSGAVCLVIASEKYDAEDYLRDYDDFLEYKRL